MKLFVFNACLLACSLGCLVARLFYGQGQLQHSLAELKAQAAKLQEEKTAAMPIDKAEIDFERRADFLGVSQQKTGRVSRSPS